MVLNSDDNQATIGKKANYPGGRAGRPCREPAPGNLEFRILGPVDVVRDGVTLGLDGEKQRTVLAALLLAGGRVLSDARLSDLLWGEHPPTTVNAQIYTYVSRLRKYLGPQVDIRRQSPGYVLEIGALPFDLAAFERLTRLGQEALANGSHEAAADLLRAALACWRGPALADVTEFLAAAELHRLEEARMAALESRIDADLALGRHQQLLPELTGLVGEHPLREQLRAKLMITLCGLDRQADALLAYHEGRRILAEEMGADPGSMLTEVYRAVLNGDPKLRRPGASWRRAQVSGQPPVPRQPDLLPPAPTDFTGRDLELADVDRILLAGGVGAGRSGGVPFLSGMAGVGKTALALRAAHALRDRFPDGQLYVDLAATSPRSSLEPTEALARLLRALDGTESQLPDSYYERVQLYRSRLAGKRVLVVLDDVAGEEQVRPLLPVSPECRAIVASRSRVAVSPGTVLIDVPALSQEEALAMLAKLAGADRVDAEPGAARRIVASCGRLPLGLRIAGARLAARPDWPLSWLADRLADEGRCLDELSLGATGIRESIQSSYDLVDDRAQLALQRVSQLTVPDFPSWTVAALLGMSSAAAERVAESLVDAWLLEASQPDRQGRPRYRLHKLVRLFARQAAAGGEDRAGAQLAPGGAGSQLAPGEPANGEGEQCGRGDQRDRHRSAELTGRGALHEA